MGGREGRLNGVYTRTGDEGETTWFMGGRVSKSNPRCEACGTIDEAVSALGLARAVLRRAERKTVALKETELLPNPEVIRYLNRASDLVFVLASYEDHLDEDGAGSTNEQR